MDAEDGLALVAFRLDARRFALPLEAVERVLPMVAVAPLPRAPAVALGVVTLGDRIVPVVDLRRRFGQPPGVYGRRAHLLLVRTPRRQLLVPADEVLGPLRIPAGAVTPPAAVLPGLGPLRGLVALPDGILYIQDLEALLALDEETQLDRALEALPG